METSALTEVLPTKSLQIRPINVVMLEEFRSIYNLESSPLLELILNPRLGQLPSSLPVDDVVYKGCVSIEKIQILIRSRKTFFSLGQARQRTNSDFKENF